MFDPMLFIVSSISIAEIIRPTHGDTRKRKLGKAFLSASGRRSHTKPLGKVLTGSAANGFGLSNNVIQYLRPYGYTA